MTMFFTQPVSVSLNNALNIISIQSEGTKTKIKFGEHGLYRCSIVVEETVQEVISRLADRAESGANHG